MPTYDYRCSACGHSLEIFQSMSAAQKKKCPACGKPKLARIIGSGAGILFKGGGFHQTDYRSDSYKEGESADKPAKDLPAADKATTDSPGTCKRTGGGPVGKPDRAN